MAKKVERKMTKDYGIDLLRKLLNSNEKLRTQKEIMALFEEENGEGLTQPTLSRWLNDLGATTNRDGHWVVPRQSPYERNIPNLKIAFTRGRRGDSDLVQNVKTAFLGTKKGYNNLIAQRVKRTFPQVVLATFCPSESDIIIFYTDKNQQAMNGFVEIMERLCRGDIKEIQNKAPLYYNDEDDFESD
ncbi:hypothetical protein LJC31_03410 [Synergistaceae bacterium OttesenSCG-928-I11]|nr:hypothetical protein [Synergistaceae bacterium OttesenSCG-928-I11]